MNTTLTPPAGSQGLGSSQTDIDTRSNPADMISLVTHVSSISVRQSFRHLQTVFGFRTNVFFPNDGTYTPGTDHEPDTRAGSIYNREASEYNYNEEPDLLNEVIVYTNLMDMNRLDSTFIMDSFDIGGGGGPSAYTENLSIVEDTILFVHYANKDFHFKVDKVHELESNHSADGIAIHKLELVPYS